MATMKSTRVLDGDEHPAIITNLIALTSHNSLLALRGTCQALRQRAAGFQKTQDPNRLEVWCSSGPHPAFKPRDSAWTLPLTTKTEQRDRCLALFRTARTVDYYEDYLGVVGLADILTQFADRVGGLRAWRIHPNSMSSFGIVDKETVVSAPTWVVVHPNYSLDRKTQYYNDPGRLPVPPQGVREVVHRFLHSPEPFAACWTHSGTRAEADVPVTVLALSLNQMAPPPDLYWPISPSNRFEVGDTGCMTKGRGWRRVDDLRACMLGPLMAGNECLLVRLESTPPVYLGYPPDTALVTIVDDIRAAMAFDLLYNHIYQPPEAESSGETLGLRSRVARSLGGLTIHSHNEYVDALTPDERDDELFEFLEDVPLAKVPFAELMAAAKALPPKVDQDSAGVFNITLYPYIADLVASESSAETLAALSTTSQAFAATVARQLAHVWFVPDHDFKTFKLWNRSGPLRQFDAIPIRLRPQGLHDNSYDEWDNDYCDDDCDEDCDDEHEGEGEDYDEYGRKCTTKSNQAWRYWGCLATTFPPMPWGTYAARVRLLSRTRVLDFIDPLLNRLGPITMGLENVEVARLVSCGGEMEIVPSVAARVQVVYLLPDTPTPVQSYGPEPNEPALYAMRHSERLVVHLLFAAESDTRLPLLPRWIKGDYEVVLALSPFDAHMRPEVYPVLPPGTHRPDPKYPRPHDDDDVPPLARRRRLARVVCEYLLHGLRHGVQTLTLVNLGRAAEWFGYASAELSDVETDLAAQIRSTMVATAGAEEDATFEYPHEDAQADLLKWLENKQLSPEAVAERAMARLSFTNGESYAARDGIHPAELHIEPVPGERHRLLGAAP